AVRDVVLSAFANSGQNCAGASLLILVGSSGTSTRFRSQLIDAVESVWVDWPTNLATTLGPLITPAQEPLLTVLNQVQESEEWIVKPQPLDDSGQLWRPGVKIGVQPGSDFH